MPRWRRQAWKTKPPPPRVGPAGSAAAPKDYEPRVHGRSGAAPDVPRRNATGCVRGASASKTMAQHAGSSWRASKARLASAASSTYSAKVVKDGPRHVELFYGTPSPGNPIAAERYAQNRFSVTRQLRYSRDETQRALDLGLFINGLPVATFELKNSLTKQTIEDAVEQYKRDRDPREKLLRVRPLRGALRGGRPRGAILHAPQRERARGSCPSTRAGTTAQATRRIRTASRPTTCGSGFSPATG